MIYVLVLPRKNCPVYQCFTLGTLKNLVWHEWWAFQYLALWTTYRNQPSVCPDAEWTKLECVAKQKQYPYGVQIGQPTHTLELFISVDNLPQSYTINVGIKNIWYYLFTCCKGWARSNKQNRQQPHYLFQTKPNY